MKSLGGISVSAARVFPKGLEFDRRWMLVDEHGMFMTQRAFPAMSQFRLSINGALTVTHTTHSITIPLKTNPGQLIPVKIWDDTVNAFEVSRQHSQWFSEILGMTCKLVHFPENNPRPVNPKYKVNDDHVSLADAYPFLLIGQSSLDDLNQRLPSIIPMNRFRPNFVFTGGEPFEEDGLRNFKIGNNRFVGVKPCDRCVMTTINQETGEKGVEPLKTLAKYRQRDNKIYFGQNIIALDYDMVSLGDAITVSG